MYIEPGTAASIAFTIYEHRGRVLPILKKIGYYLRHGHLQIAVFGVGGTGKTRLGEYLAGELRPSANLDAYEDSIGVEQYKLQGDIVCSLIVPPGQKRRAEYSWPELYRDLVEGKSRGIINVVSWGYHSFAELQYKETKYYQEGMSESEFIEAYLQAGRDRELEAIKELTPRLIDAKKRIWMITLVNKQDLWWHKRVKVKEHYLTGAYNDHIEQIAQARGRHNFVHEYRSAALVISNFTTSFAELLAPTVSGYDQSIQYTHLHRLLDTIYAFAKM